MPPPSNCCSDTQAMQPNTLGLGDLGSLDVQRAGRHQPMPALTPRARSGRIVGAGTHTERSAEERNGCTVGATTAEEGRMTRAATASTRYIYPPSSSQQPPAVQASRPKPWAEARDDVTGLGSLPSHAAFSTTAAITTVALSALSVVI